MRRPFSGRQRRPAESKSSSTLPLMCLRRLHMLRLFCSSSSPHSLTASHHPPNQTTMQRSALLLVVLAVSPLATAAIFECMGGVYTANSTYEANLRRLAAVLPAETASSQSLQAFRGVGFWPNRLRAFSHCYRGPGVISCASCVAGAFREAERACPYGKKVVVFTRNCTLSLADFPRSGAFFPSNWLEMLGAGLVFQAIGFGWLFFLLLQEWRDKRRSAMMHSSSVPSGDQ